MIYSLDYCQAATQAYKRVTDSLHTAITRELSSIINRIHKVDFSKPVDPMSMGGSGSVYMKDLVEKLTFLKSEILGRMSLGEMGKDWWVTNYVEPYDLEANEEAP